jgi:hypothetical protein
MTTTDAAGHAARPLRKGIHLRLSPVRVAALALLLIVPWAFLIRRAITKLAVAHDPVAVATQPTHPRTSATTTTSSSPYWGDLTITRINLEPPADLATRFTTVDTGLWYVRDSDAMKVDQLFKDVGFTDAQRADLVRGCKADPSINGFVAHPELSLILDMPRSVRDALYPLLAREKRNAQADTFRQRAGHAADTWFDDSGLANDTIELARKLMYRHGDAECIADVSALVASVPAEQERAKLMSTLARQNALLVTLQVRPTTDLAPLVAYWGKAGREREVEPLLKSVSRLPEGSPVDVARLLPRFARARLSTFPDPVDATAAGRYDCHWSSLNFFNTPPDESLTNPANVATTIQTKYRPIDRPSQLGDVIFLLDADGSGIHSAAYVAAGVVFTKNGSSIAVPWQMMPLADLEAHYRTIGAVKTVCFRRNDL